MTNKHLFIRGDLNALDNSQIPLRNPVWISILKNEYGSIENGQLIWLYEKTVKDNVDDLILFPGTVRTCDEEGGGYLIEVNENDFEYLSESIKFKNYSIQDVIGTVWEEEVEKHFPDYKL